MYPLCLTACVCWALRKLTFLRSWHNAPNIYSTLCVLQSCKSEMTMWESPFLLLEGDDTMTGDGGEYLRPEDLKELGDDSLPSSQFLDGMNYLRYSLEGGRSDRYFFFIFTKDVWFSDVSGNYLMLMNCP